MLNRIIAIGDVHGCYYTLEDLIAKVDIDFERDIVIFLGDYIDRGKWPVKVVNKIIELQERHPNNIIALKGNHEDMCARFFRDHNRCWTWNGYEVTYEQLSELADKDRKKIIWWMEELEEKCSVYDYSFCHSGFFYDEEDEYGYSKTLWDRSWLELDLKNKEDGDFMIFGHTPMKAPYYFKENLCIDTGCVYGGNLTAAIIENDTVKTVSVRINERDGEYDVSVFGD